jgi:hypothetical protein
MFLELIKENKICLAIDNDATFFILQDGFVLVGSVAGQRYWSSMLPLESTITCGIWTPDDQQVTEMLNGMLNESDFALCKIECSYTRHTDSKL